MENKISAQELRIGNIVILNGLYKEENIIVQEIKKNGIVNKDKPFTTPFMLLKPIPLTEEWLIKLGFKKEKRQLGTDIREGWFNKNIEISIRGGFLLWYSRDNDNYFQAIRPVHYVHELQNLFFALTGKEITTKKYGN